MVHGHGAPCGAGAVTIDNWADFAAKAETPEAASTDDAAARRMTARRALVIGGSMSGLFAASCCGGRVCRRRNLRARRDRAHRPRRRHRDPAELRRCWRRRLRSDATSASRSTSRRTLDRRAACSASMPARRRSRRGTGCSGMLRGAISDRALSPRQGAPRHRGALALASPRISPTAAAPRAISSSAPMASARQCVA